MDITNLLVSPLVHFKLANFSRKAADYRQQKITLPKCYDWLNQFPSDIRYELASLLGKILYFSEEDIKRILQELNERLIKKLNDEGIPNANIIYVTLDEPGSSSHLMLNLLRNEGNLERRGFRVCDSKNIGDLISLTAELGNGAIVYIDDFSASGKQFLRSRNHIAEHTPLIGSFSEFFLLPCICTEAYAEISKVGVTVTTEKVHHTSDRPLHPDNRASRSPAMMRVIDECNKIDPQSPIGFDGLATMVVMYSNAPNSTPKVFRGFAGQEPTFGILPRSKDRFADGQIPPNSS